MEGPEASVRGKRVVVTGGASGIGRAIVELFAAAGAEVAALDWDRAALDLLAKEIAGVRAVHVDVSDPDAVASVFADLDDAWDGLDVAIANAGISSRVAVVDLTPAEWRRMLDVNLSGVFYVAQQAGRRMTSGDRGGVILVMGSTNGITGHPNYAHYNAAKAGVIALAKTMALELAPKVRVNAICPGYVLTDMQRAEYTDEMLEAVNAGLPLRRHAAPEEVARLFLFLASDWGAYITGQAVVIDGGELA
jgi:meso-butanediol dehydrogenase/(S,S)-butanediol dehydrogenase/diacetyl reductase